MSRRTSEGDLPKRRSMRLPHHNYRWTASYFVTIRAAHHEPVFEMIELHTILSNAWKALPDRFPCVSLDEFVIMPDHIHGILHFHVTDNKAPSLGGVIGVYKSITPSHGSNTSKPPISPGPASYGKAIFTSTLFAILEI